ncbi:uncharacterized protein Dwil_GK20679 [Drosophila willistoni]|uniref:Dynactin subunit 2 n=1 Tax=Drosophila willistoni TaxID=7260 RepID=B4MK51_DROWI|nr:dynactin subunit 2 [Drosophila willistoni]EDW72490.1 uncharacterized protein Dwil_GK20679 [Drosophila willistoni]
MADPKFQNLPGIAYDQPDVYETPDEPEGENTSDFYDEEPENEAIERLHISANVAHKRFSGATLEGSVDFSESIGRRIGRGYDMRGSCDYVLMGQGEKETPVQKCQRLQIEMNELLNEVAALQVDRKIADEEKQSYDAVATVISTAKKVLESLKLEQVLGKEQVPNSKQVKALISQVEEFKQSGVLTAIPTPGTDFAATARVASLEQRLYQLEKAVGAQPEKLSRLTSVTNTSNVLEAVRQLSTKAALLQPEKLDAIEQRLSTLTGKMDAIAEKSSGSAQDAKRDQKIVELYDIAKRTEPVVEILPQVIERMQALEALHKYANNFAMIIAEIEQKQGTITTSLVNNKELLHSVQETFAQNLETINSKVAKVEQRVTAVTAAK